MFSGGFEIGFILFIAFLLFGPKKLPEIARVLGKGLGELRRASFELRNSLEEEVRNLEREVESQRKPSTESVAKHEDLHSLVRSVVEEEIAGLPEPVAEYGHDHSETTSTKPE